MKRCSLWLTTLASVALTAWILPRAGGWSRHAAPTAARRADATVAAWHYFQGGPRHWRSCLLTP
jgi:hypothetical protein